MKDNYTRKAIVTKVIDGDTFEAIVDLGYYVKVTQTFRLLGLNTPEIKGVEKSQGLIAKDFVTNEILNKEIYITSQKTDTFRSRWLATVYYTSNEGQEIELNTYLLDKGFASVYIK